jgi:hypothetical protein
MVVAEGYGDATEQREGRRSILHIGIEWGMDRVGAHRGLLRRGGSNVIAIGQIARPVGCERRQ